MPYLAVIGKGECKIHHILKFGQITWYCGTISLHRGDSM